MSVLDKIKDLESTTRGPSSLVVLSAVAILLVLGVALYKNKDE